MKQQEAEKITTEPNTVDCVAVLSKAKINDAQFNATHGTHLTSNNVIKSVELDKRMVLR